MYYRGIITVPKDKAAQVALDYDEASPAQLLEVTLDEVTFNHLWRIGLFERINAVAGSLIDRYEDDAIEKQQTLMDVLKSGLFSTYAEEPVVAQVKVLFEEALARGTGVYFYF